MDSSEEVGGADRGVHYSTGRLTPGQAAVVDRWRARLLLDRPLPGKDRVSPAARMLGFDDRPRASCSDAIAAAVADLLRRGGVSGLDLVRYAEAGRLAVERKRADAPVCQPVSYYLPSDVADQAEELRAQAHREVAEAREEIRAEARRKYPDDQLSQAFHMLGELATRGLPAKQRQVPRGAIARLAVDRWADRSPDEVAAAAVDYASEVHLQAHRARRDMRQLRP
jgi:hypothetical protein